MDRSVNQRTALLVTTTGSFLTPFMGSSVNIALRSIGRGFTMDAVLLSGVSISYILAAAIFLVPFGRSAGHGKTTGRKEDGEIGRWGDGEKNGRRDAETWRCGVAAMAPQNQPNTGNEVTPFLFPTPGFVLSPGPPAGRAIPSDSKSRGTPQSISTLPRLSAFMEIVKKVYKF